MRAFTYTCLKYACTNARVRFSKVRFEEYPQIKWNYRRHAVYVLYRDDDGRVRSMTKTCKKLEDPDEAIVLHTAAARQLQEFYNVNHHGNDVDANEEVHADEVAEEAEVADVI